MLALEMYRSEVRYLAAQVAGRSMPTPARLSLMPLRLVRRQRLPLPEPGWVRVRPRLSGICGSDLAFLTGNFAPYFLGVSSFPFILGHEVVGDLLDPVEQLPAGTRVILDPVLGCAPRGLPLCSACVEGAHGRCDHITGGHLAVGAQTGYCADTGGGWGETLVAHSSQLYAVPDDLPDAAAVLVEPLACAIHAVQRAQIRSGDTILVVGAGTMGILTLIALRALPCAADLRVLVAARHRRQQEMASTVGPPSIEVVDPATALGAVRRATGAMRRSSQLDGDYLLGGVDVAIVCAGTTGAIDLAQRTTRAGGRVVLSSLPGGRADLSPTWLRELEIVGSYTSGSGRAGHGRGSDFQAALGLARETPELEALIGAAYPLTRWREAIDHALDAGRLGTFKVAFAPRATRA